jgi:hypothetical protein
MISNLWSRKSLAGFLAVAVLSVYSMIVLATPGYAAPLAGELSAFGAVSVNGQKAASGTTVFSDSMIVTATDANAMINLGKVGRVEVMPGSTLKLSFSENSLNGQLEAGQIRVATAAGVSANITTNDGAVKADESKSNNFTVDMTSGKLNVTTITGAVAANGKVTKAQQTDDDDDKISGGALAALVLAAGGAIAAIIIAGRSENNDLNFGGTVVVVSPTK